MILKTRTLHVCVCALRNREKGLNTQTAVALQGGKKGICPKAWLQSNSLCLLRCLTWLQRGKPYLNSHKALAGIPWISSPFPNTSFDKKTQVEVRQNRINQPGGKTVRKPKSKNFQHHHGNKTLVMDFFLTTIIHWGGGVALGGAGEEP